MTDREKRLFTHMKFVEGQLNDVSYKLGVMAQDLALVMNELKGEAHHAPASTDKPAVLDDELDDHDENGCDLCNNPNCH